MWQILGLEPASTHTGAANGIMQRPQMKARQKGACWNCDQVRHLQRDCPIPLRARALVARAMLTDKVPPIEVSAWLSQETEQMEQDMAIDPANDAAVHAAEVEETADQTSLEESVGTFDTLFAALARHSEPSPSFQ